MYTYSAHQTGRKMNHMDFFQFIGYKMASTTAPAPASAPTSAPTTVKGIVDMLVAQRMFSIVSDITKTDSSSFISLKQIGGLLALLSLEEVRTIVTDAISYFREFIKSSTLFTTIKQTIMFVVVKIQNTIWKRKAIKDGPKAEVNTAPITHKCEFELDDKLFIAILNHIWSKGQLQYDCDYTRTKYITSELKSGTKNEIWNHLTFISDDITYYFNNYDLYIIKNSLSGVISSLKPVNILMETDDYRLITKEGLISFNDRCFFTSKDNLFYVNSIIINEPNKSKYKIEVMHTKSEKTSEINNYFPNSDQQAVLHESVQAYLAYICKLYEYTYKTQVTQDVFNILIGCNDIKLVSYDFTDISTSKYSIRIPKDIMFVIKMANAGYFVEWKYTILTDLSSQLLKKTEDFLPEYVFNSNNNPLYLPLKLKALSYSKTPEQIADNFDKLLKSVCSDAIKLEKDKYVPQKTYFLSIGRKTTVQQIPNPEFDSWLELKNAMMIPVVAPVAAPVVAPVAAPVAASAAPMAASAVATPAVAQPPQVLMAPLPPPPPKTIEKETEDAQVICKEIGTCYKPLDTLYISEKETDLLTASIEMFRDQKEMLKELGLPNKYGLFLSGPPGTGKTSTIYAVATYLQKPLYYVGLNDVRTNCELQALFEHVYEKSVEGGIVVLEDIDAMTSVVLARESVNSSDSSIVSVMRDEDSELTLSYFLNLLDGAMSRDGMITIASSNYPEKLDAAFLRDGRFDIHIHLGYADKHQISKIFKMFFKRAISDDLVERIPKGQYTPANFIFRFKTFVLRPATADEVILEPFLQTA